MKQTMQQLNGTLDSQKKYMSSNTGGANNSTEHSLVREPLSNQKRLKSRQQSTQKKPTQAIEKTTLYQGLKQPSLAMYHSNLLSSVPKVIENSWVN